MIRRCKYCGREITTGTLTSFCCQMHKVLFHQQKRINRVMAEGPEVYIRKALEKRPELEGKVLNSITIPLYLMRSVIPFIHIKHTNKYLNLLNLHKGDIVSITVTVTERK